MLRRYIVLLLTILSSLSVAFAQNMRKVTGEVCDEFGDPMPGASVVVKGNSTYGTITDVNGKFNLSIPADSKMLEFRFMGMKTQELAPVYNKPMRVFLSEDSQLIEEVVVVGYGSARKLGSVTGSLSTVGAAQIENTPSANFTDALQGQVAGLSVLSSSGEPTASANIRLRGVNSMTAGNEPLFIMD